jgi:hypothetical protein
MKKVRYAIGAVGTLPALGLTMPAANAASAIPQVNCGAHQKVSAHKGSFYNRTYHSGTCLAFVSGVLGHSQAGLTMRTRVYSVAGFKVFSKYVGGKIVFNSTDFQQSIKLYGYKTCVALVENGHRSIVKYGPACTIV